MYNANNYGYNPYGNYYQPRPIQPIQQNVEQSPVITGNRPVLSGKLVDSLETAKASDFQLDGSISYYPLTDSSAIVTKQLQLDGTSKITVYKPILDTKEEIKYITQDDMKKAIDSIDLSELEDIKEDIKDLRQEFKDFKKTRKKDE